MGYVFDFKEALEYDRWLQSPENRYAMDCEQALILEMLDPSRGRTLLDIGCGSGLRLAPLIEKGVEVTGLDPSPYMLDLGKEKYKNRIEFHRGFGENLPFEDNAFHYVTLVNTLEYVQDPQKVIDEAARVAKDRIFIGIGNRYAFKCLERRIKGIFFETVYNRARFYSIWQIKQMVRNAVGNVPMAYKTLSFLSMGLKPHLDTLHLGGLAQKNPFGAFAGVLITPVPRFKTTPLVLKFKSPKPIPSGVQPLERSKTGSLQRKNLKEEP
ncbi:MAG: class I SAM-dependent methyltransferase [Proteobacteria bacterium]|nr:class I SAM-dependent methyltransferase [Pseudomonadota bacterium]MBU4471200.1 class I SAM-dependent methyltransferase [Pseudomonadota bacterium]MCG2753175.1 class I SAM-dependent methyltransferase [Desulfobacteraceae bacterium]